MIKKLCGLLMISFISIFSIAQKPVKISGIVKNEKLAVKPIKLFKVVAGESVEIGNCTPNSNGEFGFFFYPDYEGLYVIGSGTAFSPNDNYKFYFKQGDNLSVALSDYDYKLTGTGNSKENIELTQWHIMVDDVHQKAINFFHGNSTYVDFFPQLEATAAKAKTWLNGKHTGNAAFDKAMPGIMKMDMYMYATNFLQTPRTVHPSTEELSNFYATLKTADIAETTDLVYKYPWGIRTLMGAIGLDVRKSGKKYLPDPVENMTQEISYVPNDTLKGNVVLNSMGGLKSFEKYKQIMDVFRKYVITDVQKKKDIAIVAPLATWKKGDAAFNFSYPDVKGKQVGLKDLKGKVVLVDVWATWCGPCKAEIPDLKKLEEEMKDKDIQFVSISVDDAKDKDKWRTMIDTAHLGGTQLFAGGWKESDFATYYKITGIPRFLVFDKEGKIVTVDSPRPSNPKLKELLEKTLAD